MGCKTKPFHKKKKKQNENEKALELSPAHADVFGNMGVWTQQSEQKEDNVIEEPYKPRTQVHSLLLQASRSSTMLTTLNLDLWVLEK